MSLALLGATHLPSGPVVGAASITDANFVGKAVAEFRDKLASTPITYEVARRMADRAVAMANRAEETVKAQGSATLIGPAMFQVPRDHVRWHLDALSKELAGRDPKATPYERFDDLRKWVAECYRAMLSASQDASLREAVRAEFWSDVANAVAAMPAKTIEVLKQIPGAIVESATGIPLWAWALIAVLGTGLLGYAAYRILLVAAPTVAGHVTRHYLVGGG